MEYPPINRKKKVRPIHLQPFAHCLIFRVQCDECGKHFSSNYTLKRHIDISHVEKECICDICAEVSHLYYIYFCYILHICATFLLHSTYLCYICATFVLHLWYIIHFCATFYIFLLSVCYICATFYIFVLHVCTFVLLSTYMCLG